MMPILSVKLSYLKYTGQLRFSIIVYLFLPPKIILYIRYISISFVLLVFISYFENVTKKKTEKVFSFMLILMSIFGGD